MPTHVANPSHQSGVFLLATATPSLERTSVLPGVGSDAVQKLIDEVVKRWEDAQRLVDELDVNDIEYHAMPANRKHRFRVRLRMRGAGRPMPFKHDD